MLRDQITSGARTVLLVLLAASALVFIIACSNVANLILARTVRREGELAIRAALGASTGALRRTLLAESLLLCGAGALLGVLIAQPMVAILARYASRFSVRALDLTVDSSMLWVGALLAIIAAVILAFVPRLPSADASQRPESRQRQRAHHRQHQPPPAHLRRHPNRRVFILLAGASMLIKTLLALQAVQTGFDTHHVLAFNVPVMSYGKTPEQVVDFYNESIRRIKELPGVDTRCRHDRSLARRRGIFGSGLAILRRRPRRDGEEDPRALLRAVSPGFFASLGVPILAGRDFNDPIPRTRTRRHRQPDSGAAHVPR